MDLFKCTQNELEDKLKDCEIIIHLATNSGVRKSAFSTKVYKFNIIGFVNLFEAVRVTNLSIYLTYSSRVYENSKISIQFEESADGLNLGSYYSAA